MDVFSLQCMIMVSHVMSGFEVNVSRSHRKKQAVSLLISYDLPGASTLNADEVVLSPFVIVGNLAESEAELRLKIPFLKMQPEKLHSMAKWLRFYGSCEDGATAVYQDIGMSHDESFMLEIGNDYAVMHTQENVMFCIVGSRDETKLHNYGTGT